MAALIMLQRNIFQYNELLQSSHAIFATMFKNAYLYALKNNNRISLVTDRNNFKYFIHYYWNSYLHILV